MGSDAQVLVDYLGLDRYEALGGPVRKRACPNCAAYDHTVAGARVVAVGNESPRAIERELPDNLVEVSRLHAWDSLL
jgi:hypothetical protein